MAERRRPVQFDISPEDDADLDRIAGEVMARTTAARILFMYGLNNASKAFAAYAEPYEEERRQRLQSGRESER